MVHRNQKKERLHFPTKIAESLEDCEVVFIAVGTPPDEDGSADLKYVLGVAAECGRYMKDYLLIVTKVPFLLGPLKWSR